MAGNIHDDDDSGFRSLEPQQSDYANQANFEFSEFLELDEWMEEDPPFMVSGYTQNPIFAANESGNSSGNSSSNLEGPNNRDGGNSRERNETRERVAFKTETEVEILDDGFKWRKYGKKMVKNSPSPRNYYRCSVDGCPVKKRVERDREDQRNYYTCSVDGCPKKRVKRDREDPKYVITTYEGGLNHQCPSRS